MMVASDNESSSCVASGLNGVLVIHKPTGWTSHDVVAKVRALLGVRKVGHTGTLDPAATGVLVLCLGKATRLSDYLMAAEKAYRGTLRLGVATDTQDATGVVVSRHVGPLPNDATIREAMQGFVGRSWQMPPMYSALKVKGVPLYKAARAGQTVVRAPREVTVRALHIVSIVPTGSEADRTVDVIFDVQCGKGTYIRTLCADCGEALGVGGHLAALERQRVGRFGLEDALSLEELQELVQRGAVGTRLHPMDAVVADLPVCTVDAVAAEGVRHGAPVPQARVLQGEGRWAAGAAVRLQTQEGQLLAIGKAFFARADEDPAGIGTEAGEPSGPAIRETAPARWVPAAAGALVKVEKVLV